MDQSRIAKKDPSSGPIVIAIFPFFIDKIFLINRLLATVSNNILSYQIMTFIFSQNTSRLF